MQIFVRMLTGKTVAIEVQASRCTVESLKAKVEESLGIPFEQQRLYVSSRQRLRQLHDDGHKLSEYNPVESCTLNLDLHCLRCPMCTPPRYIYVQTWTRMSKTIVVQVDPSDTICDVRRKIGQQQSLFLADGNKKLNDARTFAYFYHEIPNESTLYLDFSMIQIFVKMRNGKTITLEVEPSDKISDVKAKIRDQLRIISDIRSSSSMRIAVKTLARRSAGGSEAIRFKVRVSDKIGDVKVKVLDQQRLLFNGRELVCGQTLADYGVQNESTLQVFVKMFAGQTISLVDPSDTIGHVKKEEETIVGDHQSLTFDGNELDDGKTLAEYNVIMRSTLHLD